ncbi:hypothetical protein O6H91_10G024600 [Diphasiastrum complanatum]|uniref:Uncharacterized protein n=3 Tax=Diphasiastrum complanatum TaxID=34168 RepID=A0ACC2CF87_DIPCM|nr:hypothetical protein O6H91_10G024600 [Diphasiastrum complanatum]
MTIAWLQHGCSENPSEDGAKDIEQYSATELLDKPEGLLLSPNKDQDVEDDRYLWDDQHGRTRGAPAMDTIFESHEEVADSSDEKFRDVVVVTNMANSSKEKMATSSSRNSPEEPSSSHSTEPALEDTIHAWCEATGLPTTVIVRFLGRIYNLHKFPLVSRSGFFKRALSTARYVDLPEDFPGGMEIFELVISFCYGKKIVLQSWNVAALRCASEFLDLTEEHGRENLCDISTSYLNEVALQSWKDTLVVLQECVCLHSIAEELFITSSCIEALAVMACSKLLNSEDKLLTPLLSRATRGGVTDSGRFISADWWIHDILELQLKDFSLLMLALRRHGMDEKYVTLAIVKYTDKLVLSIGNSPGDNSQCFDLTSAEVTEKYNLRCFVEEITNLLPTKKYAIPTGFFISLLKCALNTNATSDCKNKLETRIASQLEVATIEDLWAIRKLSNDSSMYASHLCSTKRIVSLFLEQHQISPDSGFEELLFQGNEVNSSILAVSSVSKLWDEYLAEIAKDSCLDPREFSELADMFPSYVRATHDKLYKAIDIYVKAHPNITTEERFGVCRILNYQKLSQKVCTHAVQNEIMPLRMIVQAMFMSQLQTRFVLNCNLTLKGNTRTESSPSTENMSSFHRRACSWQSLEDSLSRSSLHNRACSWRSLENFSSPDRVREEAAPLGLALQREAAAYREAAFLKDDFNATKSKLKSLEDELAHLKRRLYEKSRVSVDGNGQPSKISHESGGHTVGNMKQSGIFPGKIWHAQVKGLHIGQRLSKTFQKLGFKLFWLKGKQTACTELPERRSYSERWGDLFGKKTYRSNSFTHTFNDICMKVETTPVRRRNHNRHHSLS